MRKFLNSMRKLQRNNMIYVILGLQVISIVAYIFASKGLEKPAGTLEVIKFLLFSPDKYLISISLGLISWALFAIIIISIITEIPIVRENLDNNYYNDYYFEDIPTWKIITGIVLAITSLILNILFLKCLAVLLILIIIVIFMVILYSK
ncbi:hypothetical protein PZQ55_001229 [Clostridium botulinum]|nr:hypothetical protein [Clostridium botulinum]EKO2042252.1 hypothetical protein [Clostridium botulinum]